MATETFISEKYTVELLPGETEELLMIRVREDTNTYESHIRVIVDSLNIFPVIKNCLLGTHGYKLFYEMTNPQTLTMWFEARVGGFMYMEFSSHLPKVVLTRDPNNMVSRLSYKKRGDLFETRIFGGAHIQIKDRDHYDIGTTRELVISGKDTKVVCANIEHLVFLRTLTLDSLYIDLHIKNCDLASLEGLRGFPQLELLTLISCQIPDGKRLIEVVSSHLPCVKKITINDTVYDMSTTILC
jgi:hypothetical protein